jgi:hypothetical protein
MRVECTILSGFWGRGRGRVVVDDGPEAGIAVVAQHKAYSVWEKERTSTAINSISQNAIYDIPSGLVRQLRGVDEDCPDM